MVIQWEIGNLYILNMGMRTIGNGDWWTVYTIHELYFNLSITIKTQNDKK